MEEWSHGHMVRRLVLSKDVTMHREWVQNPYKYVTIRQTSSEIKNERQGCQVYGLQARASPLAR